MCLKYIEQRFFFNKIVYQCTKQLLLKEQIISKKPENNHFQWELMYYIPRWSFEDQVVARYRAVFIYPLAFEQMPYSGT